MQFSDFFIWVLRPVLLQSVSTQKKKFRRLDLWLTWINRHLVSRLAIDDDNTMKHFNKEIITNYKTSRSNTIPW